MAKRIVLMDIDPQNALCPSQLLRTHAVGPVSVEPGHPLSLGGHGLIRREGCVCVIHV